MNKFDWQQYQQDLEDAFKLECSEEDVENNKEAKKLFKWLQKQRKYVNKIEKLQQKIVGSDKDTWLNILCTYGIKY